MDVLFIVRDALASSVVGTLLTAIETKRAGSEAAVLVTQEALAALAGGALGWPRELTGERRYTLADRAKATDLPVRGRGASRQLDALGIVAKAREARVPLYACPIWSSLLGLDAPPDGLQAIDTDGMTSLIEDADTVIGTL